MPAQAATTRRDPQPSESWQTHKYGIFLPRETTPGFNMNLAGTPIPFHFLSQCLNWTHCCTAVSPKPLSSEARDAVTIEEVTDEKGKSHFPCVKTHSSFWDGRTTAFHLPLGSLKQGQSPRPSGKLAASQLWRYIFQNKIQNLWVWLWGWNMWS